MDHDQRFKKLLQEFFAEFLQLFFPNHAATFDFTRVEWLEKELFPDQQSGDVLRLDLVAQLPHLSAQSEEEQEQIALVHVEVESRESTVALRERMWEYYSALRRRYRRKVLPIALFLKVGLQGIGTDTYTEEINGHETLRFTYPYIGLPALEAQTYLNSENWLGVALGALMRIPQGHRVEFGGEALRRILLESQENDYRKLLLTELVQAYLNLNEQEEIAFNELMQQERYREVPEVIQTTYEKAKAEGQIEMLRKSIAVVLQRRFGSLTSEVQKRLNEWPEEKLEELLADAVDAPSLEALGLEGKD